MQGDKKGKERSGKETVRGREGKWPGDEKRGERAGIGALGAVTGLLVK